MNQPLTRRATRIASSLNAHLVAGARWLRVSAVVGAYSAIAGTLVVGCGGGSGGAGATVPRSYAITDLGPVDNSNLHDMKVNDQGQVVANDPSNQGFLWQAGRKTHLMGPGGWIYATALNGLGHVVGAMAAPRQGHPFIYVGGSPQDLGLPVPDPTGILSGMATAINIHDQVAGWYYRPSAQQPSTLDSRAFIWTKGEFTDLGTLGGPQSSAAGVNSAGQVTGDSELPQQMWHAFLYTLNRMIDLGTLGGTSSSANALNDQAEVVGASDRSDGFSHAFAWQNGRMNDLGILPGGAISVAYDVNNLGQVVGQSDAAPTSGNHAVLWSGGVLYDLSTMIPSSSGWSLERATGINDSGWIVGYGFVGNNGPAHGYLLVPQ